ncbi:putative OHCU decarboxylase protein [Rhodotorula diobovata]|uniref:Putative OHCU decarboxylase protein n=1 Tax=Rhodotorula diobovata TaxID=5288 RepID=A0A5C5FWS5_9BASI|nr:putative OHCU decarboxylase protein [Rhodotorula diobovata]
MTDALPPPRIDLLVHSPSPGPYIPVLKLLLEPSPPLEHLLAPQLHSRISSLPASARPKSYAQLIDLAAEVVAAWDVEDQAAFLAAHPRIGETKNLSQASQGEQAPKQGQQVTPGEVLKRLQVLNSLYEDAFPGLRFITFVNGRTRAEIVPEIESLLSLSLPPPSPSTPEPRLSELRSRLRVSPAGSQAWRAELERGLRDMWAIAKDRVGKMGVA